MSDLLFSIVIACYNQEVFVRQSVESALSQTSPSKEVIVVDDASKDGTSEVLRSFGDVIVFVELTVNGGACAARNCGASYARGRYLVFLDGDDVLAPWALDVYSRLVDAHKPKIILGRSAVCYSQIPDTNQMNVPREIRCVEYPNFLSKDRPWIYNTSALVVERAAFNASGGWTPEIFYQDIQDLLSKLGTAGTTNLILAPDTVSYRMHASNATWNCHLFVKGIYTLLVKAKADMYPGGSEYAAKRAAWFGGIIFYWMKEAFKSGNYRGGLHLLTTKWWLILLAVVCRAKAWIAGRKPVEILSLERD